MRISLALIFFTVTFLCESAFSFEGVDQPLHCWANKSLPCALRSTRSQTLERKGLKLSLNPGTSLQWDERGRLKLLQGAVYLESEKPWILSRPGFDLKVSGELWLEIKEEQKIWIYNLNADLQFSGETLPSSESVPVGFQNWYGFVQANNEIERGVIRPIDRASFFPQLAKTMKGTKKEKSEKLEDFKKSWAESLELSSQFYTEVAQRRVAMQEEKERKRRQQLEEIQDEKMRLRKLFREKNNID